MLNVMETRTFLAYPEKSIYHLLVRLVKLTREHDGVFAFILDQEVIECRASRLPTVA